MNPTAAALAPSALARALMFIAVALAMCGNYYIYDCIGPIAEMLSSQRGFSDAQIGTLNAIYSLPNIFIVLVGGVLVDRFGARAVTFATTLICLVGAMLTALDSTFAVMAAGRLLFGIGAETMIVAIMVGIAQWFAGNIFAFALAMSLSAGRLGSYLADMSPALVPQVYAQGWQAPMWMAVGFALLAIGGAGAYWLMDRRESNRGTLALAKPSERLDWTGLLRFRREYWLILGLCVAFYSVIFPFRSTFAIKYFQDAHGLSLADAGTINSYVFLAAVFATPLFGWLVGRIGRHADLMVIGALPLPLSFLLLAGAPGDLWPSTVLLGLSFSLVPAVLWPAVARYVEPQQLGTAYGLMFMIQNIGLTGANLVAGYINDLNQASAANPDGYGPMLVFFGVLSLAACALAVLLRLRGTPATASA